MSGFPGSIDAIESQLLAVPGIDQVHVADDPGEHPGLVAVAYLGDVPEWVVVWLLRSGIGGIGQRFDVRCYGSLPGGTI